MGSLSSSYVWTTTFASITSGVTHGSSKTLYPPMLQLIVLYFIFADLAQAISLVQETSKYSIPLVVFGHMHKELVHGGSRKMISVASNNTMYLNGAVVPRVKPLDSGGSVRAFTVVDISGGRITKVVETWVSVVGDKTSIKDEHLLFRTSSEVIRRYSFRDPLSGPRLV